MRFTWDADKAALNEANHGLTFEEATQVFEPGVVTMEYPDLEHSEEEDRFITVGPIVRGLVVVVWTERRDDAIRIISAWFADQRARAQYRKYLSRGGA